MKGNGITNISKKYESPSSRLNNSPLGMTTRSRALTSNIKSKALPSLAKQGKNNYLKKNESISVEVQTNKPDSVSKMAQTDIFFSNTIITNELLGKNWLSDQTLNYYFDLINEKCFKEKACFIMNPIISHAIKNVNDFHHFLDPININTKDVLIVPVNDSCHLYKLGNQGSHWSVLIYTKVTNTFYHIDSLQNYNSQSAKTIANKLTNYLSKDNVIPNIIEVKGQQQINTYDCGIYTILAVDFITFQVMNGIQCFNMAEFETIQITELDLIKKRSILAYLLSNNIIVTDQLFRSVIKDSISKIYKQSISQNNAFDTKDLDQVSNNKNQKNVTQNTNINAYEINNWKTVVKSRKNKTQVPVKGSFTRKANQIMMNQTILSPNKFASLAEDSILTLPTKQKKEEDIICSYKNKKRSNKPRVLMVADSHGRRCQELLKEELQGQYEVAVILKPNANFEHVTKDLKKLTSEFTERDYVVVIGGSNDISNTNKTDTSKLSDLMYKAVKDTITTTNVLLPGILYRFDHPNFNHKIKAINQSWHMKEREILKTTSRMIPMRRTIFSRHDHTRHGLHLSLKGKKKLCSAIAESIKYDFNRKKKNTRLNFNEVEDAETNSELSLEHLGFSEESILDTQEYASIYKSANHNWLSEERLSAGGALGSLMDYPSLPLSAGSISANLPSVCVSEFQGKSDGCGKINEVEVSLEDSLCNNVFLGEILTNINVE